MVAGVLPSWWRVFFLHGGVCSSFMVQDAKAKAEAVMQEKMQEMAGGLPLPPGMKLF